jgi:LCP family protein required for cell wall assembly
MAAGEKPYRVYRGGRQKGKVPLQRRVEAPSGGNGAGGTAAPPRPDGMRVTRPRRRWSWKRRIGVGALVVFVFLVIWAVAGYFSVRGGVKDANKRLERSAPGAVSALTKQNGIVLTASSDILLLGTDHSQHASRAGDSHSDSMLLLHTDPGRHRLVYLSIPRDLRVPIPGHGDDKINAAMQIGGPRLAIQTVREFTGLDVNHVVVVDFSDFVKLIDKVGGVDINVPAPILSNRFDCPYSTAARCQQWPGWRFKKGTQHMDGHRALIYSRIRENKLRAESDVTRGARQQQVMQALLSKLASVGTFFRLPFVGGDLLKPISTDLSTNQFIQLAWVKFRAGNVLHCRLGGEDLGGGYLTSSEHNAEVIQMVLGNSAPQPPAPGTGPYGPGCVRGLESLLS